MRKPVRKIGNKGWAERAVQDSKAKRQTKQRCTPLVREMKSNNGEILVEETKVKQRWKEYFEKLLNQENPRERRKTRTEKRERDVANSSEEEIRNV